MKQLSTQGILNGPAAIVDARCNRCRRQPRFFSPACECLNASECIYKAIRLSIVGSFFSRCPMTISWRIRAIVINSLQRAFFWARTHVRKKVLKRELPTATHFDASSTVATPRWVFAISTATTNINPCVPLRCVALAVLQVALLRCTYGFLYVFLRLFPLQAPAAAGCAALQTVAANLFDGPTIASYLAPFTAVPRPRNIATWQKLEHLKTTNSVADFDRHVPTLARKFL